MQELINTITHSYIGYYNFLVATISNPFREGGNFFYLLIGLSLLVWMFEMISPWRKEQSLIRKDFWLDSFYMFFNFFIFNLILFVALSNTSAKIFGMFMKTIGLPEKGIFDLSTLHQALQMGIYFILFDLAQWTVHNMLHRIPFLWRFHKTHHSVKEMGFAAHLRFHFMESVFYRTFLFFIFSWMFNFKLEYAFYLHTFAILVGHLNHANINWDYGPLKYIINNPKMHIWHHSKELPSSNPKGMNFGISLSIWDYIFKTAYIPHDGKDIELGFEGDDNYPTGFFAQQFKPFKKIKK